MILKLASFNQFSSNDKFEFKRSIATLFNVSESEMYTAMVLG